MRDLPIETATILKKYLLCQGIIVLPRHCPWEQTLQTIEIGNNERRGLLNLNSQHCECQANYLQFMTRVSTQLEVHNM